VNNKRLNKKIEYKIQEAKIDLTIEKINNILKELN
jgi:hypothetical protein